MFLIVQLQGEELRKATAGYPSHPCPSSVSTSVTNYDAASWPERFGDMFDFELVLEGGRQSRF